MPCAMCLNMLGICALVLQQRNGLLPALRCSHPLAGGEDPCPFPIGRPLPMYEGPRGAFVAIFLALHSFYGAAPHRIQLTPFALVWSWCRSVRLFGWYVGFMSRVYWLRFHRPSFPPSFRGLDGLERLPTWYVSFRSHQRRWFSSVRFVGRCVSTLVAPPRLSFLPCTVVHPSMHPSFVSRWSTWCQPST